MKAIYLAVFVIACGSNDSSDNGSYDSCYEASIEANGGTQACFDCTKSSCGSDLSTFQSGCPSFWTCECPNGEPVGSGSNDCQSDLVGSCATEALALDDCEHTTCAAQCGSGGF